MPMTQKSSIKRYGHTAATVLVTEDVNEVVLFGGRQTGGGIITETTIIRLGKLCSTSNLYHSYFSNSHVLNSSSSMIWVLYKVYFCEVTRTIS